MAPVPFTVSTSSGMWLQPIEPEVSINNMMFGFACAATVAEKGVLEMSVWAACAPLKSMANPDAASTHRVVSAHFFTFFSWFIVVSRLVYSTMTWV